MPGDITTYQSVIQLISGANLAIFALPQLGQASLDMESKRWERAVQLALFKSPDDQIEALRHSSEYDLKREELISGNGNIRSLALAISLISSIYLIYISAFSGGSANVWTGLLIVAGFAPGLALAARNANARSLLYEYSRKRNALS